MIKKVIFITIILLLVFLFNISSADDNKILSISLLPGGITPLGESSSYFKFGGGGGISAVYPFPSLPKFSIKAELRYDYIPIVTKDAISMFSIVTGAGYNIDLLKKFRTTPYVTAGYHYASLTGSSNVSEGNLSIKGGLFTSYSLSPSFSIGLDLYYLNSLYLYSGMGVSVGIGYNIPIKAKSVTEKKAVTKPKPLKSKPVKKVKKGIISSVNLNPVFPVLFKHYNKYPIGSAVIYNKEKSDITDISLSFFVERYMDNPKECGKIDRLKPGEEKELNLYALFSDSVLEITEGTKVSAKITVLYTLKGKGYSVERTTVLNIYDRNATMWDDNRKAAAFVTAKDPSVLKFSKRVTGWVKSSASKSVNKNLSIAMGMHEALRLYGINYVVDPKTPYAEYSKNKLAVDFLQFPRQTLSYSAGDCDDLSILYCALLESVGIETAFITIPGHIFMACSLDMKPDKARKRFLRPDELIFANGKTWLPIEVTMTNQSFLKAWEEGAKEWRENEARNQASFYPMHDCWKEYEPVGLPGVEADITLPSRMKVVNAFQREEIRYIDREIFPKVSKLQGLIRKYNNDPKYINRLGVLYARYGLYDRAERQFNKILMSQNYLPALVNMGNIKYVKKDLEGALKYYNKAAEINPNNPKVLLCVARVNHELENYGIVRKAYNKLKAVDPELAEQFAYLSLRGEEAARAAEISAVKEVIVWDEE